MSKKSLLALPAIACLLVAASPAPDERDLERRFASEISAANIREYDRHLSEEPHHVGSARGEQNAKWIQARLREWGLDAQIETYWVLFPTPKERVLEMVAPTRFRAVLAEPPVPG